MRKSVFCVGYSKYSKTEKIKAADTEAGSSEMSVIHKTGTGKTLGRNKTEMLEFDTSEMFWNSNYNKIKPEGRGTFEEGEEIKCIFMVPRRLGVTEFYAVLYSDADAREREFECEWESMSGGDDVYTVKLGVLKTGLYYLKGRYKGESGEGVFYSSDGRDSTQISVYKKGYETPEWYKGGIMYQIFVDRFAKSKRKTIKAKNYAQINNDWQGGITKYADKPGDPIDNIEFFGGNLYGISENLDYLRSLGVNILYLSPIFEARTNHKYDTGDYMKIDEMFGGQHGFEELLAQLKKRDMRLILDGVFSHTGDDSVYFNKYGRYDSIGAYQSKASEYYDWYKFKRYPDDYESWWGVQILPALNKESNSYMEYIMGQKGVARHYIVKGAHGWRLDVADELSDEFLSAFRDSVKSENPDSVIIGEVWEDASNKVAYGKRKKYFLGEELDGVMNYPYRESIIKYLKTSDERELARVAEELYHNYPVFVSDVQMNILGTHDTERILSVLGDDNISAMSNRELSVYSMSDEQKNEAKKRLKVGIFLQYTLPGVPCIYYGDEIGMYGGRDPFNRQPFCFENADSEILEYYKKAAKIRLGNSDFVNGKFEVMYAKEGVFIYRRGSTVCGVNMSDREFALVFDGPCWGEYELRENGEEFHQMDNSLFCGGKVKLCEDGRYKLYIPEKGCEVIKL